MSDRVQAEKIIDGIVEHGRAIEKLVQAGNGEWHLRTMLKVYDWAVAQQPFAVGDRVFVLAGPFDRSHGYSPYNDVWLTRPEGVVESVEFNGAHDYWAFAVRLDVLPTKLFGFSDRSLKKMTSPYPQANSVTPPDENGKHDPTTTTG